MTWRKRKTSEPPRLWRHSARYVASRWDRQRTRMSWTQDSKDLVSSPTLALWLGDPGKPHAHHGRLATSDTRVISEAPSIWGCSGLSPPMSLEAKVFRSQFAQDEKQAEL